jgi:hypothetical protein
VPLTAVNAYGTASQTLSITVSATAPTTSVLAPANGATVTGTSNLDATAASASGISKVEFHLTGGTYNQTLIGTATATIYGYILSWNSTTVPNGTYTLQSEAYGTNGTTAYSSAITITVSNAAPTTSVLAPANGATVTGTSNLDATAASTSGITKVEFHLTGGTYSKTLIGTASATIYGYLLSWNSTTVPNGTYTLQSEAYGTNGLTTYSTAITITVSNAVPTTSVISPASGTTLTGTSYLDATAASTSGISKVEFHLTGGTYSKTLIGTASATVYGYLLSWNSTTVPNGSYTLQSEAYGTNGTTAYSAAITVIVKH